MMYGSMVETRERDEEICFRFYFFFLIIVVVVVDVFFFLIKKFLWLVCFGFVWKKKNARATDHFNVFLYSFGHIVYDVLYLYPIIHSTQCVFCIVIAWIGLSVFILFCAVFSLLLFLLLFLLLLWLNAEQHQSECAFENKHCCVWMQKKVLCMQTNTCSTTTTSVKCRKRVETMCNVLELVVCSRKVFHPESVIGVKFAVILIKKAFLFHIFCGLGMCLDLYTRFV